MRTADMILYCKIYSFSRTMGDEMFSSAKVRLCGSWAAKLASRASDVNFTVLMQPSSLFAMLDVKVRPILYLVYDTHHLEQSEGETFKCRFYAANTMQSPPSLPTASASLILRGIIPRI